MERGDGSSRGQEGRTGRIKGLGVPTSEIERRLAPTLRMPSLLLLLSVLNLSIWRKSADVLSCPMERPTGLGTGA